MRIALFLLLPLGLIAQSSEYSIGGVVLNAQTGDPVKSALVTLTQFPDFEAMRANAGRSGGRAPVMPQMITKTAFSGLGGEFHLAGLPSGKYHLTAAKPQFVPEQRKLPNGAPDPQTLDLKSSITDAKVTLSPLGVIEGQVLDQNREPVRGVNIMAITVQIADGLRTTHSDRSVATNTEGRYRLWNLMPGKYYIKAAGWSGGTYSYVGDRATLTESWEGFVPAYAGGAHEMESALPIALSPGADITADVKIVREPAAKIRGALANFVTHETVIFELLRGKEDVSASRVALNATTGRFEILNVIPGSYVLRATQGKRSRGETVVSVSGSDADVSLSLQPATTVKVATHALAPSPKMRQRIEEMIRSHPELTAGVDKFDLNEMFQNLGGTCNVQLHSPLRNSTPLMSTMQNPDAARPTPNVAGAAPEFVIPNVLAGDYRATIQCGEGTPMTATMGGQDLLANPHVHIDGTSNPEIEISMKPGGGVLTVQLSLKQMPEHAALLAVPTFAASNGPTLVQVNSQPDALPDLDDLGFLGRSSTPPIKGPHARFIGLAAGDYVVYALPSFETVEFREPSFLQSLRGGVPVHVDDLEETVLEVTTLAESIIP